MQPKPNAPTSEIIDQHHALSVRFDVTLQRVYEGDPTMLLAIGSEAVRAALPELVAIKWQVPHQDFILQRGLPYARVNGRSKGLSGGIDFRFDLPDGLPDAQTIKRVAETLKRSMGASCERHRLALGSYTIDAALIEVKSTVVPIPQPASEPTPPKTSRARKSRPTA